MYLQQNPNERTETMQKNPKTATNILACLIAFYALLQVAVAAGPNILANGSITVKAGTTNAVGTAELSDVLRSNPMAWGEIAGFRIVNAGTNAGAVTVSCTDLGYTNTLFKWYRGAATNEFLDGGEGWYVTGSNFPALNVRIVVDHIATNASDDSVWNWYIYAR